MDLLRLGLVNSEPIYYCSLIYILHLINTNVARVPVDEKEGLMQRTHKCDVFLVMFDCALNHECEKQVLCLWFSYVLTLQLQML